MLVHSAEDVLSCGIRVFAWVDLKASVIWCYIIWSLCMYLYSVFYPNCFNVLCTWCIFLWLCASVPTRSLSYYRGQKVDWTHVHLTIFVGFLGLLSHSIQSCWGESMPLYPNVQNFCHWMSVALYQDRVVLCHLVWLLMENCTFVVIHLSLVPFWGDIFGFFERCLAVVFAQQAASILYIHGKKMWTWDWTNKWAVRGVSPGKKCGVYTHGEPKKGVWGEAPSKVNSRAEHNRSSASFSVFCKLTS